MCSPCQTRKPNSSETNFPLGVKIIYLRAWSAHISDGKRKIIIFQIKAHEQRKHVMCFPVGFSRSTSGLILQNRRLENRMITIQWIITLQKHAFEGWKNTVSVAFRMWMVLHLQKAEDTDVVYRPWPALRRLAREAEQMGVVRRKWMVSLKRLESGWCVFARAVIRQICSLAFVSGIYLPRTCEGKKLGPVCMYLATWVDTGWDRRGKRKVQLFFHKECVSGSDGMVALVLLCVLRQSHWMLAKTKVSVVKLISVSAPIHLWTPVINVHTVLDLGWRTPKFSLSLSSGCIYVLLLLQIVSRILAFRGK